MKQKFNRWLAKIRLIHRYEYLQEVNKILEEYLTQRILDGGSADFIAKGRQDLINKQNEIKETTKMLDFLRTVKL